MTDSKNKKDEITKREWMAMSVIPGMIVLGIIGGLSQKTTSNYSTPAPAKTQVLTEAKPSTPTQAPTKTQALTKKQQSAATQAPAETKEECIQRITDETTDHYRAMGKTTLNREDVERFTYVVASQCKLGKFQ